MLASGYKHRATAILAAWAVVVGGAEQRPVGHVGEHDQPLPLPQTGEQQGFVAARGGAKKAAAAKKEPQLLVPDHHSDPKDPRGADYEPRQWSGLEEGGQKWTFGRIHATLQHVLAAAPEGNASAVADTLDTFSAEHELGHGLGATRRSAVEAAATAAVAEALSRAATGDGATAQQSLQRGLHVLVLGAGLGSSTLRCLPILLNAAMSDTSAAHEIVSVEHDDHLSDAGAQLLRHALGSEQAQRLRHLPLLPGADTTLLEVLHSLRFGYELGPFDLTLLEGRVRDSHAEQLAALLERGVLRPGSVVHAEGPGRGDAGTERLLTILEGKGSGRTAGHKFDVEMRDVWDGASAVIATYRGKARDANEL
eukprot:TRINITY_DN51639_c0_g4_i1.p1 TRINITY_DN51639_c0_g4~~TRINITY_DN51639_c0_g4_i1.p1  ORF type:complete len:366 (-),score=71.68 TRINITY_DN51639_c0_g4_i1:136-1233(-)